MLSSLPEEFELLDRDSDKAGQKRSWVSNMPHFHFCTCKWMTEKMRIVFFEAEMSSNCVLSPFKFS